MLYRNEGHPLVFRRRTTTYYFLKGRRIWQQPSLNKQSSKKKKTRRLGNAKSLSYLRNQLLLFQNWVLLTWKLLWTHLASFEVEEILLTFSNGNVKSFISTTTEKTSWVYQKNQWKESYVTGYVIPIQRGFFQGAKFEKKIFYGSKLLKWYQRTSI